MVSRNLSQNTLKAIVYKPTVKVRGRKERYDLNNRQRAIQLSNGRCFYCGEVLTDDFELDHMIPKSKGGKGGNNLVACCKDCNAFKSDLDIEHFRKKLELLIYADFHGRVYRKYFGIKRKKFQFYFEKENLLGAIQ